MHDFVSMTYFISMKENDKSGHVADNPGNVDEGQHELSNESHVSLRRDAAHYLGHRRRHVKHRSVVKPVNVRQHDDLRQFPARAGLESSILLISLNFVEAYPASMKRNAQCNNALTSLFAMAR